MTGMLEMARDEDHMVRRAQAGDAAAFATLVRPHQVAVLRLARRMVGPDASEDVLQQVLLKAWLGLPGFNGGASFGTWLRRVATNACLDHRRRGRSVADAAVTLPLDQVGDPRDPRPDPADLVAESARRQERQAALTWALDRMPESDRRLLRMHVIDRLGYADIAAALAIPPSTVGTRLYRARVRLRRLVVGRLAPALVAALVALTILVGPEAMASAGLFLRHVLLRESAPPAAPTALLPLRRLDLAEAQARVPWQIRRPTYLPEGYRLGVVYVGDLHAFADGPSVILEYARGDAYLQILEVRASGPAIEDVAPGAARAVQVSGSTGLAIDGRWVENGGDRVWRTGTMLRLIVQRGDLVVQVQADPRDGWWDRRLVELVESLR